MSQLLPIGSAAIGDWIETVVSGGTPETGGVVVASGFYGRMQATASKLLQKYATGSVIFWTPNVPVLDESDPEFDPLNPYTEPDASPPATVPVNAAVFGYSDKAMDGERIIAGDRKVLLDAASSAFATVPPKKGDTLIIDDVYHLAIDVQPIPAAGTVALFKVQARTA